MKNIGLFLENKGHLETLQSDLEIMDVPQASGC